MKQHPTQKTAHVVFLSGPDVQTRYRRSHVTIWRWTRDAESKFPHPIRINGYNYWRLGDLEEWETALAEQETVR